MLACNATRSSPATLATAWPSPSCIRSLHPACVAHTASLHLARRPCRHQPARCRQRWSATQTDQDATSAAASAPPTHWAQTTIQLNGVNRGCHVITRQLVDKLPQLAEFEIGLANFFILHTSASLTINENASPDVPLDLNDSLDRIVPEGHQYRHLDEGMDDMPAHVKSSLMGASLTLPISHGRLALGTWQGIYLNEHRNYGGPRSIMVTMQGVKRADGRKYR